MTPRKLWCLPWCFAEHVCTRCFVSICCMSESLSTWLCCILLRWKATREKEKGRSRVLLSVLSVCFRCPVNLMLLPWLRHKRLLLAEDVGMGSGSCSPWTLKPGVPTPSFHYQALQLICLPTDKRGGEGFDLSAQPKGAPWLQEPIGGRVCWLGDRRGYSSFVGWQGASGLGNVFPHPGSLWRQDGVGFPHGIRCRSLLEGWKVLGWDWGLGEALVVLSGRAVSHKHSW